jgi:hypothetical protein
MTKIAAIGMPKALDLFRKLMMASAAIPSAFLPSMIDVEIDGKLYQEMHVDGGGSAQMFYVIRTQGIGDLYRIYLTAQRDGVDYNLTYIPASFDFPHKEEFDTAFMRALFKNGYDAAVKGYPWDKTPPGF